MIAGFVHGAQVDGHFFDCLTNYYQAAIHDEWIRSQAIVGEMAGLLDDDELAAKYREQAAVRPFQYGTVSIRSGPLLSMGRGRQCQVFLDQTDEQWIGMSDSDMVWKPELWRQLVGVAERGGPTPDGGYEPIRILAVPTWIIWTGQDGTETARNPNIYRAFKDDQNVDWLAQMTAEDLANPGLYKDIGAVGGALLLVHRDALVNIRDNLLGGQPFWFHHLPTPPVLTTPDGRKIHDQYGEDTSFSIRAREAGETIWVLSTPEITLGHAKTLVQY